MNTLDHRISINRGTETRNDFNEVVLVWAVLVTVWARRADATANEAWRAAEVGAQIEAHYTVRYSPETASITPKDTVTLEDGKTYNIFGVTETERNRWLEIHCIARADK